MVGIVFVLYCNVAYLVCGCVLVLFWLWLWLWFGCGCGCGLVVVVVAVVLCCVALRWCGVGFVLCFVLECFLFMFYVVLCCLCESCGVVCVVMFVV